MKPLHEIYRKSFFGKRYKLDWRVPIICDAIENTFNLPIGSSIIDVGCARGEFVKGFEEKGFFSCGIEGPISVVDFAVSDKIFFHDLRVPINKNIQDMNYNLCISLEVAEHIEEEYCDIYLDNLCFLSDMILISAATPGTKGHYHVNCQPQEYWEKKFLERNYFRSRLKEDTFKKQLEKHKRKKGISGYYYHSMIYRRMK
jgi:hypothetical protein